MELLLLPGIFVILPFIRYIVLQIKLIIGIKRVCKEKNYEYVPTHRFLLFSSLNNAKCDLYIKTYNYLYSIKLCGFILKKTHICFGDSRTYAIKRLSFQLSSSSRAIEYTQKSKPAFDFKYHIREQDYDVTLVPILLMCPVCFGVYYSSGNKVIPVSVGDNIGECLFYNSSGFIKRLESETKSIGFLGG